MGGLERSIYGALDQPKVDHLLPSRAIIIMFVVLRYIKFCQGCTALGYMHTVTPVVSVIGHGQ